MKNDLLARATGRGFADAREKRHEPVIVVLRPFFEWMMMALRALQPRPEKQLCRILHLRLLRTDLFKPGRRRALVNPAGSREDFSHKLVVRLVIVQAFLDPVVKGQSGAKLGTVGTLVAQQRRPFVGKILGVFLTAEQALDESLTLVRRWIIKK